MKKSGQKLLTNSLKSATPRSGIRLISWVLSWVLTRQNLLDLFFNVSNDI